VLALHGSGGGAEPRFGIAALAFAAWLTDSTGPGRAQVGNLLRPTVNVGNAQGEILPGGSGNAAFMVVNPNTTTLKLTAINPVFGSEDGGSTNNAACPFANLAVNPQTGLSINVPPGTNPVNVPDGFRLAADAPSDCQGVLLARNARLTFSTNGSTP
jgi:hypothetical protein